MSLEEEFAAVAAQKDHQLQRTPQQLEIARSGTSAIARILVVKQTTTMIDHGPLVDFTLEVQGPEGPYRVQTQFVVPLMSIPAFQPGATIELRVDPKNRDNVVFVLRNSA